MDGRWLVFFIVLGLVALASGRAAWCPTVEAVAEHLRASGYELTTTLVLPEPDVALLAQLSPT